MSKVCKHEDGTEAPHGLPGVYNCATQKRFVAHLDAAEMVNGATDPDGKLSQVCEWIEMGKHVAEVNPELYQRFREWNAVNRVFPGSRATKMNEGRA